MCISNLGNKYVLVLDGINILLLVYSITVFSIPRYFDQAQLTSYS